MWICLNDAFFSIVYKDCLLTERLVRARRRDDIERYWPDAAVTELNGESDYQFRAVIPLTDVQRIMFFAIEAVDYPNFKNSVGDHKLHAAYNRVWNAMADLQEIEPYAARGFNGHLFDDEQPRFTDAQIDAAVGIKKLPKRKSKKAARR